VTQRRADLLLITAAAVWGVSFVVVKEVLAVSSPLLFVALRFTLATLILAPFVGLRQRFSASELRAGIVLTLLLASGFATQAVGLQYTTPARSAFIVALSSVLAPIVAVVAVRHRMNALGVGALVVAGVGIYLLTNPSGGGLNRGDMWTLITSVVFGGHIVAVSEFSKRFDARRLVWLQLPGTAVGAGLAAAVFEPLRLSWTGPFIGALVFTAVFSTAMALIWQMRAQRFMSSMRASLLLCFEPLFATLTSWFYWGERFSLTQGVGAGLILGGMVLAVVAEARAESGIS